MYSRMSAVPTSTSTGSIYRTRTSSTLHLSLCKARFPSKRNRLRCVNENRKKRKRLRWQAANYGCHCYDRAFLLAARNRLRFLRFLFTQRTRLRLDGNRA